MPPLSYIRTKWSVLNPPTASMPGRIPIRRFTSWFRRPANRKLPLRSASWWTAAIRGANTPQFVYDAGAEYAMSEPKYPDRKTPMPQDPVFQRYYEKFVEAFAAEFNDPENTLFIDGYGLGKWGRGSQRGLQQGRRVGR